MNKWKNWKFVINVLGMIGSFIGTTIGNNELLMVFLDKSDVVTLLAFELVWPIGL